MDPGNVPLPEDPDMQPPPGSLMALAPARVRRRGGARGAAEEQAEAAYAVLLDVMMEELVRLTGG
jgi:hypothetical protein